MTLDVTGDIVIAPLAAAMDAIANDPDHGAVQARLTLQALPAQLARRARITCPITSATTKRFRPLMSEQLQLRVWSEDSFMCRYCNRLTVFRPAVELLASLCPDELRTHPNWMMSKSHILFWVYSATCDHIVPHAQGGSTDRDNLVTACYSCQDAKNVYLNEEAGYILQPRSELAWDGPARYYPMLFRLSPLRERTIYRRWMGAIGTARTVE